MKCRLIVDGVINKDWHGRLSHDETEASGATGRSLGETETEIHTRGEHARSYNHSFIYPFSENEAARTTRRNIPEKVQTTPCFLKFERKTSFIFPQFFARNGERHVQQPLTHWGRATHVCVGKLTINGSDNGLSPGRRQAIIWTNVGILLNRTLRTNFSEILSEIRAFSFKKMRLKVSSAKRRPFCLGLNVLSYLYGRQGYVYYTPTPWLHRPLHNLLAQP